MTPTETITAASLAATIDEAARVLNDAGFDAYWVLSECGAIAIIADNLPTLESLGAAEVARVHEWVLGYVDIELAAQQEDAGKLTEYSAGWTAQAWLRFTRLQYREALVCLDLIQEATERLQGLAKRRTANFATAH